ncbi:nipblb [Symbiodinium necroappetens]|uniref:Nipblb protein n=1 Tax=Symbiodinium necroappetens TaxID=1628268 RepID=A0A813A6N6_9DINO|nr:nipblb [Symbiodinium necroappetens]
MAFEHAFSERLPQFGATLEQNAERSAKAAAWAKGIHVADPAGTMKQMFNTFIGKRLLQHEVDKDQKSSGQCPGQEAKQSSEGSSSSSSSKREKKKKEKKVKSKKGKKGKKVQKSSGEKKEAAEIKARLKREREAGDAEASLDPKYAKIIDRFRQNVNPLLKKTT